MTVHYGVTGPAVLQGFGIGLLVSLLFSLVPLLDVRHVKPSLLLRDEPTSGRFAPCRFWRLVSWPPRWCC